MSIGAMIGGKLIDKGIDQFSWGVGQEYRRHERHRLRDYATEDLRFHRQNQIEDRETDRSWQVQDTQSKRNWDKYAFSREFEDKMRMADKFGIHPLAMIPTSGGASSQVISRPPAIPGSGVGSGTAPGAGTPSGGGWPSYQPKPSKGEQRIINANARRAEAEAALLEDKVKNMGQSNDNFDLKNNASVQGQGDSDLHSPEQQAPSKSIGVESKIGKAQRYTVDQEGNFYLVPSQSYEQAFGDEGTMKNRFLYEMRDTRFPVKINNLKRDWNNPKFRELKRRWLQTRPNARKKDEVVLWNGINWQAFYKTPSNAKKLFARGVKSYSPNKTKKDKRSIYGNSYNLW